MRAAIHSAARRSPSEADGRSKPPAPELICWTLPTRAPARFPASSLRLAELELLRHRTDEVTVGSIEHAANRPASAGVNQRVHVEKEPLVRSGGPVEPHRVIYAHHPGAIRRP